MTERIRDDDSPGSDQVITSGDLAREWGVSQRTILRYITDGRIPATRLPSGRYRIRRADVADAVQPTRKEPTPTLREVSDKLDALIERSDRVAS
ncbi:helix-turn-helix domain-containing protein [Nocardia otitidiscaviarum]|uniref:helix-turn-helix domain-containing protein n=1 Tax=Nocardia otitidiscaviarum TaxID=1823 RepID=UPI0009DF5F73|nr:helix-turn-helix domain-containing protein [Nocardia otitidiscaviarum]